MMAARNKGQGILRGGQATTENGCKYYEFLGIPYAKPPIGELRFKSPQSPEPWAGIRDCTTTDDFTISCQPDPPTGTIKGREDCLYLNVYTPSLSPCCTGLKAVMVYFHGGGFVTGNGTLKNQNGPDYLVEHDVVIVTVNYRLGLLGYLNLEIPEAAGNMGLKDQIKALQWVQNHIFNFSGDENNVTIFGSSAGSTSCEFLMLSPLTKGLFHRCIMQSGSALNGWTITDSKNIILLAKKIGKKLGFRGPDDMHSLLKVLSKASARDLTSLSMKVQEENPTLRLYFGFVPSIEKDFANNEAALTETPYTLLKEGKFNRVPVMRGFCNKEGSLISALKPSAIEHLVKKRSFTEFWPYTFKSSEVTKYNSRLIDAYKQNCDADVKSDEFAIDFFGDLTIAAGVYLASKLQSEHLPLYLYKFCYDGKLNKFKTLLELKMKGASHSDEAGYIFGHSILAKQVLNRADIYMRGWLTKMWTDFAKTGKPTPDDCPLPWPVFEEDTWEYLNIDNNFTVKANYEPKRMSIFNEIMEKYEK